MPDEKESKEYIANREALAKKSEEVSVDELAAQAKKAPKGSAFALLFGRGNDFERDPRANLPANFGTGSFSGVNVRDLEANVVTGTTAETIKVEEQVNQPALPLLRYINLPGGSIEIKIYESVMPATPKQGAVNKQYSASRTLDGKKFEMLCDKVSLLELLEAISSRAMGWLEEQYNAVFEQPKLETSMEEDDRTEEDKINDNIFNAGGRD